MDIEELAMRNTVDLELWSASQTTSEPLDGKAVAARCRAETGLPGDVVLGLTHLPDAVDARNLAVAFRNGEALQQDFESFCESAALVADSQDFEAASRFLIHWFGQPLAWLHFPADSDGKRMAAVLFHWAEANNCIVTRGQSERQLSWLDVLSTWPAAQSDPPSRCG